MRHPSRREVLQRSLPAVVAGQRAAGSKARPNIIVVVTDDQRWDAFSRFGRPSVLGFMKTPNMDRLAAEGVHFRNAFVTTSLCSPSRASIMSGQWARTHGVRALEMDLRPECPIFPGLLREAGYDTGFVGKWHLGKESDIPDPAFCYWAGFRAQGAYFDPVLNINGTRTQTSGYVTDVLTDHALEFIARKRDQPFLLYLGHKAPHSPVLPPKDLASLYTEVKVELPATYYETHDDKPAWFVNFHDHDYFHLLLHPREKYEEYLKNYCRTLVSVDRNLGRLLHALDQRGLTENTALFWLGDNGHFLAEHQLYSKMIMYEEAIRIPLLVRFPRGVPANTARDELVLNVDLAPTILGLAGVQVPGTVQGRSFVPLMAGKAVRDWRRAFLYEYFAGWGMPSLEGLRTAGGWQYARYPDWEQLYNLHEDPRQVRNLARDPRYSARKQELIRELRRLGGGRELEPPPPYKRGSGPVHLPHGPDFK